MPHIHTYLCQGNPTGKLHILHYLHEQYSPKDTNCRHQVDSKNINSFFSTKETDFKHEFSNLRPWQRFLRRRGVCKHA